MKVPTCSSASPSVSPAYSTHACARNSSFVRRTPTRTTAPSIPWDTSSRDSATDRTRHWGRITPCRAARTSAKANRRASGKRPGSALFAPTAGVASSPTGRERTVACATSNAHCAWSSWAQSRGESDNSFLAICEDKRETVISSSSLRPDHSRSAPEETPARRF